VRCEEKRNDGKKRKRDVTPKSLKESDKHEHDILKAITVLSKVSESQSNTEAALILAHELSVAHSACETNILEHVSETGRRDLHREEGVCIA